MPVAAVSRRLQITTRRPKSPRVRCQRSAPTGPRRQLQWRNFGSVQQRRQRLPGPWRRRVRPQTDSPPVTAACPTSRSRALFISPGLIAAFHTGARRRPRRHVMPGLVGEHRADAETYCRHREPTRSRVADPRSGAGSEPQRQRLPNTSPLGRYSRAATTARKVRNQPDRVARRSRTACGRGRRATASAAVSQVTPAIRPFHSPPSRSQMRDGDNATFIRAPG